MKHTRRILISALLVSSAALLVIIVCAHQFLWGKHFPAQTVTPKEMMRMLQTSNVSSVSTAYPNKIRLQTKLGFRYDTIWRAIPGTDYENTYDATDLVLQILRDERGLEPEKDFYLFNLNSHTRDAVNKQKRIFEEITTQFRQ